MQANERSERPSGPFKMQLSVIRNAPFVSFSYPFIAFNHENAFNHQKVVSIGHFPPSFLLQSLQIFSFVSLNQEPLYVLIALKIKEK